MVTLREARQIIAAAEAKASEIGQPMNIAVVDGGGNLVSHVRMDEAWIGRSRSTRPLRRARSISRPPISRKTPSPANNSMASIIPIMDGL
jgi:uncharacterized protein GlcG (DUF336 family)